MPAALYQLGWECMKIAVGLRSLRPGVKVSFPGMHGPGPFGLVEGGNRRVYIERVGENALVAWAEGRGRPPAEQAVGAEELPRRILVLLGPALVWDADEE